MSGLAQSARRDFGFPPVTQGGESRESQTLMTAERAAYQHWYLPATRGIRYRLSERLLGVKNELCSILEVNRTALVADTYERLLKRLDAIIDPEDWDQDDELPSIQSFKKLIVFLENNPEFRYPSVFINSRGLFTASWRPEKRRLASLVFQPSNDVNWLVFLPRKDDPEDVIEIAGRVPFEDVLIEVSKHGALEWMRK